MFAVDELCRRLSLSWSCQPVHSPAAITIFNTTSLHRPTNLVAMTKVYAALPDVTVKPLHFAPEDISGERLLAMMKVDENSRKPEIYVLYY